jgi:hypothetical protein
VLSRSFPSCLRVESNSNRLLRLLRLIILKGMGFVKGPSASSASGLEAYDKLFGGDLTADDAEALDELFSAVRPRRRKTTS